MKHSVIRFVLLSAVLFAAMSCERTADPEDPMLNLFTEVTGGCSANYRFEISDRIETRSIVKGKDITWEEGDSIRFWLRVISISWSTLNAFAQHPGGMLPCADHGTIEGKFVYENNSWVTYLYNQDDSSFSKTEEVTVVSPDDGGYCAVEAKFIYSYGELSDPNHYSISSNQTLPFTEGTQTIVVQLPLKNIKKR